MSSVTNHPLYVQTVKNFEKTAVRDKLMRLVQYFSRFLAYYLYRKGYTKEAVLRVKGLQKNLGMARKAMRIGKPLGNLRALVAELHNKTAEPLLHYTSLTKNAGTAVFLTLDSLQWLNAGGVIKLSNPELISRIGNRAWLISILSSLIQASYAYYRADAKEKALAQEKVKDQAAVAKVASEKSAAKVNVLWHSLDALIPATNLGILGLDEGIVGLAGTTTAFLGLKSVW